MKLQIILLATLILACANKSLKQNLALIPYPEVKSKILTFKENQTQQYLSAKSEQQDSIVKATKTILFDFLVNEIFPSWYGTRWDYNGTTETPQEGKIACGYFVTTTLRDLGFDLNRYKYAQMASEAMILKFNSNVKRFSNVEDQMTLNYFNQFETGIFIVGMDSHTGFIVKNGKEIKFIHAVKYGDIDGVVSQNLESDNLFNLSSYKVIGEILTDEMVQKWLEGEKFE